MWSPYFLGLLADANKRADRVSDGLDFGDEALIQIRDMGGRWIEAELHRIRGESLLAADDPDRQGAEACFHRAIAVSREQGARLWELHAVTSLARLWLDQNRKLPAFDLLTSIYAQFSDDLEIRALRDAKSLLDGITFP